MSAAKPKSRARAKRASGKSKGPRPASKTQAGKRDYPHVRQALKKLS